MPLSHINAGQNGPQPHTGSETLREFLTTALPERGPIIIMIHGFKFVPGDPARCPHEHILSLAPIKSCWKALSWPRALGFGSDNVDEGLGISFGWDANGTIWQAYVNAEKAGHDLAELISLIHDISPGRSVHLLGHSLGARVALCGISRLPENSISRVVLLSAAEYREQAQKALSSSAGQNAEIINVTSRENDLFDFLLERLIPPSIQGDRALGLGLPQAHNTLTLQMDDADTIKALANLGFYIAPPMALVCHWSLYLRPGIFDFYRSLMRDDETFPLAHLRNALPPDTQPRWSRLQSIMPKWNIHGTRKGNYAITPSLKN